MKNKESGFNILEIVVVVGLIGILLAVMLPSFSKNKAKSRDMARVAEMQTIRTMLEQYKATCGVYPATLESDTNNGRAGDCAVNLGSFGLLPVAPQRATTSLVGGVVDNSSVYDGYFYAGLSTRVSGPCFEYHLGTELEFATNNGYDSSGYLEKDHDFDDGDEPFDHDCLNSNPDFNGNQDNLGIYDFRSTNTQ